MIGILPIVASNENQASTHKWSIASYFISTCYGSSQSHNVQWENLSREDPRDNCRPGHHLLIIISLSLSRSGA